jgi:hypothetical protein
MSIGDEVYITAFVKVYEAKILAKDQNDNRYIVEVKDTGEKLSIRADMLTIKSKKGDIDE